jgi:hypothetical protein
MSGHFFGIYFEKRWRQITKEIASFFFGFWGKISHHIKKIDCQGLSS